MKKNKSLVFSLLCLSLLPLSACKDIDTPEPEKPYTPVPILDASNQELTVKDNNYVLDFYALNDFHGSVVEDIQSPIDKSEAGMERIGAFIRAKREENKGGSFFISSGDMFQGSADSNITYGKLVMEMMNLLDFSVSTVGNHEFDWTIPTLLKSLEETNAKFPLLACNIIDKPATAASDSGENVYASWAEPYRIIERGIGDQKVKVGIIGSIATQLEKSILASAVRDYEFEEPLINVSKYATQLRDEGCDVIIYTTHGDAPATSSKGGQIHEDIPNYVDAIFTGHLHRYYNKPMVNDAGKSVPVLQAESNGKMMSYVSLGVNKDSKEVSVITSEVLKYDSLNAFGKDKSIKAIHDRWNKEVIAPVKGEELGSVSSNVTLESIGNFTVTEMLKYAKTKDSSVVGAYHNASGGIRSTFEAGKITYGDVYKSLPFDNSLYFITVYGSMLSGGNFSFQGGTFGAFDKGVIIESGKLYRIVLVSYIAEHQTVLLDGSDPDPFKNLGPIVIDNTYPRDVVAQAFRDHPQHKPLG